MLVRVALPPLFCAMINRYPLVKGGAMPRPWLRLPEDREVLSEMRFRKGDLIEARMWSDSGDPQGSVLLEVLEEGLRATSGYLVKTRYFSASYEYLQWWYPSG